MKFDDRDHGRLILALVATLLVVPTVWLFLRDDGGQTGTVGSPGGLVVVPFDPIGDSSAELDVDGTLVPAATTPAVVIGTESTRVIARPRATYTRNAGNVGSQQCSIDGIDSGLRVTIVNVANGLSVRCRTIGSARDDGLLVLHAEDFVQIASLVEAPIHVEVRL